jgi:hypothetical protein
MFFIERSTLGFFTQSLFVTWINKHEILLVVGQSIYIFILNLICTTSCLNSFGEIIYSVSSKSSDNHTKCNTST